MNTIYAPHRTVHNVLHKNRKNKPVATAGRRERAEQSFKGMSGGGGGLRLSPTTFHFKAISELNTPRFPITNSLNRRFKQPLFSNTNA